MAYVIAFAGKGGTGKTTLSGLTIRYLKERRKGPILAVDADANSNLNEVLGLKVYATVGGLREQSLATVRAGDRPGGMSMDELFDYQVQQCLIEAKGFDLLVMGRPEGPGCYCAANNIIRKYTDKMSEDYPYVVMDNEAGLEHLSRRTTHDVDRLIIVSDPTVRGIITAKRIIELVKELSLKVKSSALIINRIGNESEEDLKKVASDQGLNITGFIPSDEKVFEYDIAGIPLINLPPEARSLKALYSILDSLKIP
ncbi:MAG: AAA family ATPase [Nitrospirae bacterium]|nr:AAA family ATPase [Nitrospirota bacterium]